MGKTLCGGVAGNGGVSGGVSGGGSGGVSGGSGGGGGGTTRLPGTAALESGWAVFDGIGWSMLWRGCKVRTGCCGGFPTVLVNGMSSCCSCCSRAVSE